MFKMLKEYTIKFIQNSNCCGWEELLVDDVKEYSSLGKAFKQAQADELPTGWEDNLSVYRGNEKGCSSR